MSSGGGGVVKEESCRMEFTNSAAPCLYTQCLALSFFSPFTLCKCANLFPFSFPSFSSFVAAIDFCALADSLSLLGTHIFLTAAAAVPAVFAASFLFVAVLLSPPPPLLLFAG